MNRAKSADHEIGKLCAELCELKAENRKLKRALWLARAEKNELLSNYRELDNYMYGLMVAGKRSHYEDYETKQCGSSMPRQSGGVQMSELKHQLMLNKEMSWVPCYLKSEVDEAFEKLEESHKMEVEQLLIEIAELKNRIAPKQSDKTLQERLNEVCEKHGVSTLQDLDWAFCECEKRNTKDRIEADRVITRQKYKRCLAMAKACDKYAFALELQGQGRSTELLKRHNRAIERKYKWLAIAEKFKDGV